VSSPAKTRTCPHGGKVMQDARTVRCLGVLPELSDEVVTVTALGRRRS